MAFVIGDRVRETSTTTGTGSFTLAGAVTGYQTFDTVLDTSDTTYYTIADQSGANFEVGIGTFTAPATLARTTILSSSNGGSVVTFGAGTKDVFISLPASKTVQSFSAGSTGLTPSTASFGPVNLAGTLVPANGGTGTATAFTAGSVVFAGASGVYAQDNTNLFFDDTNNRLGIGTSSPSYQLTIQGTGQETANLTDAGNKGGSLFLRATAVGSGSGGAVLFGTTFGNQTPFAAIKGFISNGGTNTVGDLTFSTRNTIADTSLTERFRIGAAGQLGISGANYGTSGQVLTSGGSAAVPSWSSVAATGRLVNTQAFTSSGTYTRGSGVTTAVVIAVGGGGGGKGANGGGAGGNGGNGGTTSFGAHVTAAGGTGSTGSQGGAGGTGGTSATIAIPGQGGGTGLSAISAYFGGIGGGQGGGRSSSLGAAGTAGSRGGGGSGGSDSSGCTQFGGGGGGQGETGIKYTTTVGATESVTIGAGGTAGTGPSAPGGAGGAGYIIVYEYS